MLTTHSPTLYPRVLSLLFSLSHNNIPPALLSLSLSLSLSLTHTRARARTHAHTPLPHTHTHPHTYTLCSTSLSSACILFNISPVTRLNCRAETQPRIYILIGPYYGNIVATFIRSQPGHRVASKLTARRNRPVSARCECKISM